MLLKSNKLLNQFQTPVTKPVNVPITEFTDTGSLSFPNPNNPLNQVHTADPNLVNTPRTESKTGGIQSGTQSNNPLNQVHTPFVKFFSIVVTSSKLVGNFPPIVNILLNQPQTPVKRLDKIVKILLSDFGSSSEPKVKNPFIQLYTGKKKSFIIVRGFHPRSNPRKLNTSFINPSRTKNIDGKIFSKPDHIVAKLFIIKAVSNVNIPITKSTAPEIMSFIPITTSSKAFSIAAPKLFNPTNDNIVFKPEPIIPITEPINPSNKDANPCLKPSTIPPSL